MKKNIFIIPILFIQVLLLFSGCTYFASNQSLDTGIPEGLYVSMAGDKEFMVIQDAIDAAPHNSTVFVFSGIYDEMLIINKTIHLIGENPLTTIIDAKNMGRVITITDEGFCTIKGFTIQNSWSSVSGIEIKTSNNKIINNIIKDNYIGINTFGANYNSFFNNTFLSNRNYAIYLSSRSDYNILANNHFEDNSYGLRIKGSYFNLVIDNDFSHNRRGIWFCCGATSNIIYNNNFINNSVWAAQDDVGRNIWYNDTTNRGNYWSDYNGTDENNDGIGDTAYHISSDGSKKDPYPLINPSYIVH